MKELYELKDYGKKDMSAGSLEVVDKLAHTIKNLDKIIEGYENGESSYYPYAYDDGMSRGSYRGRRSYNDGSYRNEGSYRYSRHNLTDKLHELMDEAPDEKTRMEIKRLIDKME